MEFTKLSDFGISKQQKKYIEFNELINTKLIACAGSGKTRCIIFRINYLINSGKLKNNEILMLTFSRFTKDDFLNKINSNKITCINKKNVKTIDSFAKSLIDMDNKIDVSLLSYKFMKYLENTNSNEINKNTKISSIKTIFVDEAQDLNLTQYKIISLLKKKCNIIINLIGDPNQNIYQFRNSSDKYLMKFKAKIFYLTQNFRSYNPIIQFSKYLRPLQDIDIIGIKGNNNQLPTLFFHKSDYELEKLIVKILKDAKEYNIDYSDIALLAPTRGRMQKFKSNGLCIISNILYKNNIKFKQFYEESTDEINNVIKYKPKKGHVNVLTYMGSKGLEWKHVIIIDAELCLINKRYFDHKKHITDQYLLYVACSRAIENLVILSKYQFYDGNLSFKLNPWFSFIPSENYIMDSHFLGHLKYPKIEFVDMGESDRRVTRIIDRFDEQTLDKLSDLCNYENFNKKITQIYDKNFSAIITSNIFLGRYVENLFIVYFMLIRHSQKRHYRDIENIINSHIITDVPNIVYSWFYTNREKLDWDYIEDVDQVILNTLNEKFDRNKKLSEHTIINDGYFKSFILSMRSIIESYYNKYLKATNKKIISKYLFHIIIVQYALETQHYFHVSNHGKKFENILEICSEMFDKIYNFAQNSMFNFTEHNKYITNFELIGEIDLLEENGEIWEIKCVSNITFKHILQVIMYNIMFKEKLNFTIHFINFLKGEILEIPINFTQGQYNEIINMFKCQT